MGYLYYLKDKVCGKVAYYLTRKLVKGNALSEDALINLDGSKTVAGEALRCGSCERPLKSGLITDIEVARGGS